MISKNELAQVWLDGYLEGSAYDGSESSVAESGRNKNPYHKTRWIIDSPEPGAWRVDSADIYGWPVYFNTWAEALDFVNENLA